MRQRSDRRIRPIPNRQKKRPAGGGAGLFLFRASGRRCWLVTPETEGGGSIPGYLIAQTYGMTICLTKCDVLMHRRDVHEN